MSTADLLKMSADELADPTTKGKRLAARDVMTKSSIVENTEETIEAKRRQAMSSGEEIWRNRQDSVSQINIAAPIEAASSIDTLDADPLDNVDDRKRVLDAQYAELHDPTVAPPRKVSRQSSNDSGDGLMATDPQDSTSMPAEQLRSALTKEKAPVTKPKIVKPPSVLDLIRSSSIERSATTGGGVPSAAASRSLDDKLITSAEHAAFNSDRGEPHVQSNEDDDVVIPASAMVRSGPFYHCSPRMLLNSDAETEISVSFPNMNIPKFSFTGIVTDR